MEIHQEKTTNTESTMKMRCTSHCTYSIVFLGIAFCFGLVGGLLSPYVLRLYNEQTFIPKSIEETSITPRANTDSITEDTLTTELVEKNAAGVVSIVITKDIPQARNFFNNPFGNTFPFFFDPFGSQNENDTRSDSESQETKKEQIGSGSGFFVSSDGLIVTNKHVVTDAEAEYTILTSGGEEHKAEVLARDPSNDIAILRVKGEGFPALALGDSDQVKVGQTVIAIGNPLGEFANSVTRGVISGLKRNVSAGGFGREEKLTDIIQTDAAINPGNSGGPLFNLQGMVIGVNVAVAQGAENIGFALPINQVKRIVEQVRATGKISVPYIGVRYVLLDKNIQSENNLPYDYGALILRGQRMTDFAVIPGSPADKAGLVENDIILEINGEKLDENHPLGNLINKYNVGEEITLKVWHKGDTQNISVKLEERR
ncbi:MAG TPA: trypsin-like peptidase domain-containing protein [Patescibacteria group bacterium]|nr:trypsin-like peptidase domain-containing protein [Patescibacteria group bacterium]